MGSQEPNPGKHQCLRGHQRKGGFKKQTQKDRPEREENQGVQSLKKEGVLRRVREEKGHVNTTCMSSEAGGENRVSFPLKPYISKSPCLFFQMSRKDANIGAVLHSLRREPHIA